MRLLLPRHQLPRWLPYARHLLRLRLVPGFAGSTSVRIGLPLEAVTGMHRCEPVPAYAFGDAKKNVDALLTELRQ